MRFGLALVVLSGCFQRYQPIRTAAKAERQQQENAEALWVEALSKPLAGVEWRTAHRHLCRLRGERITERVNGLDADDVDVGTVRRLRSQLDHCNKWDDTLGRLALLEENLALQSFAEVSVQPDHTQVFEAYPHVRALSDGAPAREAFIGWRVAYVDHLRSLPRPGPATEHLVDQLLAEAGQPVVPDDGAVQEALTVGDGARRLTVEGSCAGLLQPDASAASDAPIQADETHVLFDCGSTVAQRVVDVPFQVKKFRTEMQDVVKRGTREVNESVRVATGEANCYRTSDEYETCFPQYSWVTRTKTVPYTYTVKEPVQVAYYETQYRKENRYLRVGTARLRVSARSPVGSSERTLALKHQMDGVSPVPEATFFSALYEDALPDVRKGSRGLAAGWFLDDLLSRSDLGTHEGVEHRLLAARMGRPLSAADREAMGATWGIPAAAFGLPRPKVGDLDIVPLPRDSVAEPRPVDNDGLLRFGFPILSSSLGFGRSTGFDDLAAHRTPRSYQFMFREDVQWAVMARTPVGQFGLHLGFYGAAHVGWRSQKRYTFPPPVPPRGDSDSEPRLASDFNGGVTALLGSRNSLFGVFVGVHPRAFYGTVGYAATGGGAVPVMARLELRPVPRMPIFLSVWGYDLANQQEPLETYGAHLMLPLSRGIWLSAEHSRGQGRTQVSGLFDEDRVEAGVQPWTRTWAGLTLGF